MPPYRIDDLDDPRIQVYRELKGRPTSRQGDFFVVEGTKTVARLLASDYRTVSVLLTEKRAVEWLPQISDSVDSYILPDELASKLVGFNFHTGVVACGERKPRLRLNTLLPSLPTRATVVVCPRCDNPENLGAIIRIAAGFGVDALILGPSCCDPFSRRVLRVSMGAALRLTIVQSRWLARDLELLKTTGQFEFAATVLSESAQPLRAVTRPPRLALMFGNEDTGLEQEWQDIADHHWTIPMADGIDSLNVAVAAGIFLHHVMQQGDNIAAEI